MKEVGLLIKILSGITCGMSMIGMSVPEDMELNQAMQQIIKEDLISVEVEKVECLKNKEDNIISFHCNIDKIQNANLILNYKVSNNDYMYVYDFYKNIKSPKLAKNCNKAIMLIKNIIDSYDPIIQVASK